MTAIHIPASREYDVCIGPGLLDEAGARTAAVVKGRAAAIISDDTVFPLYGQRVRASFERAGWRVSCFVFPAGEQSKTLVTYGRILDFLAENGLGRDDVLAALGGGVAGDLGGFAASTYLRGIGLVQLPTTLLAAVDSSVGGKTAVDLPSGKNLAGSFAQPALVLCDLDTLSTLPEEIYRDGCAEVIKYGVLGDAELFAALERAPARAQLRYVIETCVSMKRDIVCEDEFDTGRRNLLNLGHTVGHAVEKCSGYTVSHGSAVAMGLATIARAGEKMGVCGADARERIIALLEKYGLPTRVPYPSEDIYAALRSDKKITGGALRLVVPEAVGRCRIEATPLEDMREWLRAGGVV